MNFSPPLVYGLLVWLYGALALFSLQSLWPLLPEPGFAWSLALGALPGLLVAGSLWLLRRREPARLKGLEWVLLVNALLLWIVMVLQELPISA